MAKRPVLVWLRRDLRLDDQPALAAAIERATPIIPLFIWQPLEEGQWPPGAASRWWLHQSLQQYAKELKKIGLTLILRNAKTSSLETLLEVIKLSNAEAIYWNRLYEPALIARDAAVETALKQQGLIVQTFNSQLLFEPWTITNRKGKPYQVFGPFWKQYLKNEIAAPVPAPCHALGYKRQLAAESLEDLDLLPHIRWDLKLSESWQPGEQAVYRYLNQINKLIPNYADNRNRPSLEGTTRLSPYLHFGEVSPRRVWYVVREQIQKEETANIYLRQLGWRDFAHHLLYYFPHTPDEPLRDSFRHFAWVRDAATLSAWQKGQTGYPIVDAGMRQLWQTGWMHNRVRMIVGSFLVKDLLINWIEGAKWFWDTLVDADLANNTLGWQWIGGCGADAAPYFRIFNPILQAKKFDPTGDYVREWLPELRSLSSKWIHCPWKASTFTLNEAGIVIGENYPHPLVEHKKARERALKAFRARTANADTS